jgi:signal transduction histidine kinase
MTGNNLYNSIKICCYFCILFFVSCGNVNNPEPDLTQYQYKETREMVRFVNSAALLFSQKGTNAFAEFAEENGKWFSDKKYIFVYDSTGICIFHPVLKELIGKNLIELTDVNGKPIIKIIISIASNINKPYGWVHYLWAEPGEIFPSWKNAYIKGVRGPDGKTYAIGSGIYNIRTEIQFIKDIVDSAAILIKSEGKDSYAHLLDKSSVFYFNDTYIFVQSLNGILLVDPSYPTIIGRNIFEFKDYAGHLVVREMLERLKNEETVYISYMWPAPGQAVPSKKLIYAKKVITGADTVVVGSSLYLMESIWKKF